MENWQPSLLSWSISRKTHFESCRRHYFYHRFWGQDPKLRWRIFEMRNLTTLTMLRGQIVHTVIAEALKSVRYGQAVTPKLAKDSVTAIIRERWQESARKLWHVDNRPPGRKQSEFTSLVEHYYQFPNLSERARDAQQVAWACVENLIGSDLWAGIASSSPSDWMEIENEEFPSFDLDGIKIYTKIDFAHANGVNTIIDWKTGKPGDNDRKQLALYSLYAQSKWEWDPQETQLMAVYLHPELHVETFTPTQPDLDAVREEVKASFSQMMELEPTFGPADIKDFPTNGAPGECGWCRFRGICEATRDRPDGAEGSCDD